MSTLEYRNYLGNQIFSHLGGKEFFDKVRIYDLLSFSHGIGFSLSDRKKINNVEIALTPSGDYTLIFRKLSRRNGVSGYKEVKRVNSVCSDKFQSTFTEVTGIKI